MGWRGVGRWGARLVTVESTRPGLSSLPFTTSAFPTTFKTDLHSGSSIVHVFGCLSVCLCLCPSSLSLFVSLCLRPDITVMVDWDTCVKHQVTYLLTLSVSSSVCLSLSLSLSPANVSMSTVVCASPIILCFCLYVSVSLCPFLSLSLSPVNVSMSTVVCARPHYSLFLPLSVCLSLSLSVSVSLLLTCPCPRLCVQGPITICFCLCVSVSLCLSLCLSLLLTSPC